MKAYVRYIGIVDKSDKTHAIELFPGVNVVTGKSSTGKSALIEIFDFCLGSSEFTVPHGVITEAAALYFVVIRLEWKNLVLARKPDQQNAFIREVEDGDVSKPEMLNNGFFERDYFIPIPDFKRELGRFLGLKIKDSDEEVRPRTFFRHKKGPTPSIRSFVSFILQHQNLIANKHALFYRFDEKEKREQTIEHFKIFLGFADQAYFLKAQELAELQREQFQLQLQIPRAEQQISSLEVELKNAVEQYSAISGETLDFWGGARALKNPARALE